MFYRVIRRSLALAIVLIASPTIVLAGTSGKISGSVIDVASGEPVIGASVAIVGTNFGTKTDEDGEYFIINVPAGKYTIAISHLGFRQFTQREVRVLVDLTTPLDFELEPAPFQMDEQVVTAERPLIQRDLTESKIIFTADRLRNLPNITTVQGVLNKYPGVVVDGDNALHVRGSRAGQTSYYYDGFSIQDPFVANSGMQIMPASLEELSLTSGGYTAEYGEAQSGIVSAVTPEGGSQYRGRVRYYEGATYPYNPGTGGYDDLRRTGDRAFNFNLSGPVYSLDPKRYNFFLAGQALRTPTHLPANLNESYVGTANLTAQTSARMKWKANVSYNEAKGDVFEHRDVNGRSYNFNLDGLPRFDRKSYLVGVTNNYNFSEQMILTTSLNQFHTSTRQAPKALFDLYWRDWPGYAEDSTGRYNGTIHETTYLNDNAFNPANPYHVTGFTTGDDFLPEYREREATYNAAKMDLVYQYNKNNQFKGGFEYRGYDITWDVKQFYNLNPYGEKYSSKPTYAAAYFQDKMEYDNFVVNWGLRYDYRDVDIEFNSTPGSETATYTRNKTQSRISPRLGISFPIAERSVMHFNYGFYYQAPRFYYVYLNLQGDVSTGLPIVGNPDLEPEETVSYELGLAHMVADDLRLDMTIYYKDINDLVTTRSTLEIAGNPITFIQNGDYGSVKGLDLSLEKLPMGSYLSASLAYSYMIANGNGSDALEPYYTYLTSTEDTLAPVTEYPLDFDQRHTLTALVEYRVPQDWNYRFMGMKMPGAWGLSMVGYFGSGLPYTPTDAKGNRVGERNSSRLPSNYTVDARINKSFPMGGTRLLDLFVEVDNLFNRRNIINVYTRTGRADTDGIRTSGGLALNQAELDRLDKLYDNDPQNYSPPRTIRTGLELHF